MIVHPDLVIVRPKFVVFAVEYPIFVAFRFKAKSLVAVAVSRNRPRPSTPGRGRPFFFFVGEITISTRNN